MGRLNRFRKSAEVWNPLGHLLADDFLPLADELLLVDDLPPLAGAVFPHDDDDMIALTDDLVPFVDVLLPGPEVVSSGVEASRLILEGGMSMNGIPLDFPVRAWDPFVQADSLPPANA
ncbi:hypothetical protein HBI56_230870 [Parastagonospora nodorum]|uniref:Uncharacterized protein n=2 Tax=Phaeosphaeria nodorum (strain SN15 / ATCC MYA-4574 / FGSC 10173) TaxID=321614 RepID=A0A7U2I8E1_PHANO|nr:hypothetical protein SNOG_16135 [Parastagonospora nodorum SN15]KAH3905096.1 hypothetical protein HBH56_223810 [Parastagonospora nodorum]EAT76507.1 hypothetical protein SNOG_16135 [Parastagonospora nodorum SN15]KAH3921924.1 hypothetical protein HBH54_231960 [Parastagonospora nodorum]KAH3939432.1 hypothetical protein HBH53_234840 [Parastagonospora nodorum]KAH3959997.1 hypothetical protein HBH52_240820 [Parastagonospora nodorum]